MHHQARQPPAQRIVLDEYNSDLNFNISSDGVTGASSYQNGFEYMWAGCRATHGVREGKVCFEVRVLEKLPVHMSKTETNPHVMRVGWSVNEASLQVGEDSLSYGYGGTGKVSLNNKFFDYGQPYSSNDIITCHIDLEANPKTIFFSKNGQCLGVAFRLGPEADGKVFYPHVTMRNMRCMVNFGSQNPLYSVAQGFSMMERLPRQQLVRAPPGPRNSADCEIIMMVGLPGCGKTYWAANYCRQHPEKKYYVLGTNTIMEKMKVMNLRRDRNYHGRWDALIKQATDVLNKELTVAERRARNYILDQTNVYPNARRRKMNNFKGYRRIAAVVVCNNEVLKQRTAKREREEGKFVPEEAVMEMKANFTLPEVGQIFDDVWFVEEDKISSEKLVRQFQREGQAFKQAAGGAKQIQRQGQAFKQAAGGAKQFQREGEAFKQAAGGAKQFQRKGGSQTSSWQSQAVSEGRTGFKQAAGGAKQSQRENKQLAEPNSLRGKDRLQTSSWRSQTVSEGRTGFKQAAGGAKQIQREGQASTKQLAEPNSLRGKDRLQTSSWPNQTVSEGRTGFKQAAGGAKQSQREGQAFQQAAG